MLTIGEKAPNFSCSDQEGIIRTLSEFSGKNLILYFYPKDDTPGCTREAVAFSEKKALFLEKNAHILGVSRDTINAHQKFCEKYTLQIPLLSDSDGKLTEAYGVWQEKQQYGRTYFGIVRSTYWIGPDGLIKKVWKNVKVDGHAEAILASLSESTHK